MIGKSDWDRLDDEDLVAATGVGELAAFDALVRRYRGAAIAVARPLVGAAHAEDIAQDAFLLAFRSLPQLDDPARFGAWLAAITRYRAFRVARGAAFRHEAGCVPFDEAIRVEGECPDPGDEAADAVERAAVAEAIGRLTPEYQVALRLHYYEGQTAREIAEFLGITVATAKWRLHRGRQLLRVELERVWGAPEPADNHQEERDHEDEIRKSVA